MNSLEKWLLLLGEPKEEVLEDLAMQEDSFREAIEALKKLAQDPNERDEYEARRKFLLDYNTDMIGNREEGREEGRQEGLAEGLEKGLEKGREEERLKTAAMMKQEQLPLLLISKITGLTLEEIKKL